MQNFIHCGNRVSLSDYRRRSPLGLGTTTTDEIQEVVLSTFSIASRATSSSSFFPNFSLTVRLLEPGHLEEDYPITTIFCKQKILNFFDKGTNKIQVSTIQPLKTLKPFDLTWRLRKQPSNL